MLTASSPADHAAQRLFIKIDERLHYMEDVALFKALNNQPIEDPKREAVVLAKAQSAAQDKGLISESIEDFFVTQISVAKTIQTRYQNEILCTKQDHKTRIPRDLETEIRPALLVLGNEILEHIVAYLQSYQKFTKAQYALFQKAINHPYLTEGDKEQLFATLQRIKLVP